MIEKCPICGEKFEEPMPDDYICGSCAFARALKAIWEVGTPIVVIEQENVKNDK